MWTEKKFKTYTLTSHEFLGNVSRHENENRNLYYVEFDLTEGTEPMNLLAAVDLYFREVGIMNHPDIYIDTMRDSVKGNAKYVVLNMDLD